MPEDQKLVEYFKRVTADLYETRERLREIEERGTEPIAIIGMACRFPGGRPVPRGAVAAGRRRRRRRSSPFPADRGWDIDALYRPRPGPARRPSYVREGGFLDDAGDVRRRRSSGSPRARRSPWTRSSGCCWRPAGRRWSAPASTRPALRGSRTGVFVGVNGQDYVSAARGTPRKASRATLLTGSAAQRGRPAGCPTRSASKARRSPSTRPARPRWSRCTWPRSRCAHGECTLALAGGVTVMATPTLFVEFSRQRGLAAGRPLQAVRRARRRHLVSEGVGWLVLERLSDAQRNGHRVLAVVRGSAVNQDGASNGLTAPNGPAQQRSSGRLWRTPASPPARSTWSRRTAPAPRSATRSRRKPSWRRTARTGSGRCGSAR